MLHLAAATDWINLAYLGAAICFIFGLKMLSRIESAQRGNLLSATGMLLACIVTFFHMSGGEAVSLIWIIIALAIGGGIGLWLAIKVPMTGMPQMVGLLNGFGGIASLLVAIGAYGRVGSYADLPAAFTGSTGLAVLVGGVTFTGSLVAFGKLQGLKITPSSPVQFKGQNLVIVGLILLSVLFTILLVFNPTWGWTFIITTLAALALGILLVIGIGGADMPVVISLLNSYSGIAASMAGFVLQNELLVITGALVGASGLILTNIMCKAMNRSLLNVLFGGVGAPVATTGGDGGPQGEARSVTPEDVAIQLEAAGLVIVVPGYGMAVAQAQHAVAELARLLEDRGISVKYAIHPVAGRMPGHMNVLLAEANVPYEAMFDLDGANAEFEQAGVALVIGANDVTNPAARHDKTSPLYGMPILDVDKARSVIVIKRSMNPGFAGVENELYFLPNCGMLFGDGKKMVQALVNELKEG
ncbi:MAG: NAD(P)(+) transhydrogenase (Re/Si-specific) subunit beta [Phycisphaeraceae bacterium]